VREDPFYLWSTKLTVWVTHWSHLPCTHHSPNVKLLGVVKLRGQPKDLGKLSKLYVEPPTIYHPHRNPLFVVKEESRVELSDDFLIPIITELQKIGDAMEITSFNYSVERDILLAPHIVKMNPLHWDDRLGFFCRARCHTNPDERKSRNTDLCPFPWAWCSKLSGAAPQLWWTQPCFSSPLPSW
jgi:hypothetical protein